MKYSRTIMQAPRCREEQLGWRAARNWPLILALVCVTVLLQVRRSRGALGSCNANNTCPDSTYCCSVNHFCGPNKDYCGVGNCIGGPCDQAPTPGATHQKSSLSTGAVIGIAVGVAAGLGLLFLGACLFVGRWRAHHKGKKFGANHFHTQTVEGNVGSPYRQVNAEQSISAILNSTVSIQAADLGSKLSYETLHKATNGFSVELGRGSFGVVYKGTLPDGTEIAVKQLLDGKRDAKDFEAEVKTLGRINHANLVALLGFTIKDNSFFLVYEFVENGSLEHWIFESAKADPEFVLPWRTRVNILKGTAKGLAYLHEELQRGQMIVHLDIKPQNILLNMLFEPKISDFGLAKLLGSATTKETLAAGGTKGYMAPEVFLAAVSQKMDVYSFGIVMLEVVSGRGHEDRNVAADSLYLPSWAIRKLLAGEAEDVVDRLFELDQFDSNEAARLIWIALLCLQGDPTERPEMSSVLRMIEGTVDPLPMPPALQAELERAEKLIRGSLRESVENLIKFSNGSQNGSQRSRGRSERHIDSNELPLIVPEHTVSNT